MNMIPGSLSGARIADGLVQQNSFSIRTGMDGSSVRLVGPTHLHRNSMNQTGNGNESILSRMR